MGSNFICKALTDPDFKLRAFSDYTDRKQEAQSQIIAATTGVLDLIDDTGSDGPIYPSRDQIESYLTDAYPDLRMNSMVLLGDGYISLGDLLSNIIDYQSANENVNNPAIDMHAYSLNLKNAAEVAIQSNLGDAIESLKTSYHSIVCLSAANKAMLADSVADKLAIFRDNISRVFSNAFSDVSSSAAYLTDIIEKSNSSQDYLDKVNAALGITLLAEDNSQVVPNDTDMSKYTGASPAGPLCFDGIASAASTVINIGAKVIGNLFKKVGNGVKKLFNKVKRKVHQVVVNPYDLYIKNDAADATEVVDSFSYQGGYAFAVGEVDEYFNYLSYDEWNNLAASMFGNSYVMKFAFGELLINPSKPYEQNPTPIQFDVAFKPKPIKADLFLEIIKALSNGQTTSDGKYYITFQPNDDLAFERVASTLEQVIASYEDPYYDPTEDSERSVYIGFCLSLSLLGLMSQLMPYEIRRSGGVFGFDTGIPRNGSMDYLLSGTSYNFPIPDKITNLDFIAAVSGYSPDTKTFRGCDRSLKQFITGSNISSAYFGVLIALVNNLALEYKSPADFPFLPYRKNKESFTAGKFGIKTDNENYQAFNSFLTTCIIAVVVVAVAITAGVVARKVTKAMRVKKVQAKSILDSKMWNGEKLTQREARKYLRLERRLGTSSTITSGLLGSSSLGDLADEGTGVTIDGLYQIIVGH